MSEHHEQVALFDWIKYQEKFHPELKFVYAVPNGGKRNVVVAKKLKAEGVRSGVLDIFVSVARRGYHGMYIEMKMKGRKLTENQLKFKGMVEDEGYRVEVCYNAIEAIDVLKWYLEI